MTSIVCPGGRWAGEGRDHNEEAGGGPSRAFWPGLTGAALALTWFLMQRVDLSSPRSGVHRALAVPSRQHRRPVPPTAPHHLAVQCFPDWDGDSDQVSAV
jgi:hypothetical protein